MLIIKEHTFIQKRIKLCNFDYLKLKGREITLTIDNMLGYNEFFFY